MKRFLLLTCTSMLVFTGFAVSQQMNNALAGNLTLPESPKTYMNDINTRATRDFVSRYKDVNNVVWYKTRDNYVAVFSRDSIHTRLLYNLRGDHEFTMKYYEERYLRRDVRALVKSVYFDYSIFIIQEIEKRNYPPVYIVNVQDSTCWKKLKVCSGEMEVIEEFIKR